jgi:hypothetical protein
VPVQDSIRAGEVVEPTNDRPDNTSSPMIPRSQVANLQGQDIVASNMK